MSEYQRTATATGDLPEEAKKTKGITMVEAVNLALQKALEENPLVLLLGEDIGVNGGVFRATAGLCKHFGEERVIDTPLAESMLVGAAVGMSAMGLRPVVEIQFMGFHTPSFDQVVSHLARLRNRTMGELSCPVVVRMPCGGEIHAPEHHSEQTEAFFAHLPGLRVVVPSSPKKAYGLLLAAIRDPDPVIFLEPKWLYRKFREPVEDDGEALPLDKSFVIREGDDITVVSWGAIIFKAMEAAQLLAEENISVEVIDAATLGVTFDEETVLQSVEKTGRVIIAHEATMTGGFGAEIAARVAEKGILYLSAPIRRVTSYDIIMPLARQEKLQVPQARQIAGVVREVMESS